MNWGPAEVDKLEETDKNKLTGEDMPLPLGHRIPPQANPPALNQTGGGLESNKEAAIEGLEDRDEPVPGRLAATRSI